MSSLLGVGLCELDVTWVRAVLGADNPLRIWEEKVGPGCGGGLVGGLAVWTSSWRAPTTEIWKGCLPGFNKTIFLPVELALFASLNLIQAFNFYGLQRTVLRKADAAWCGAA